LNKVLLAVLVTVSFLVLLGSQESFAGIIQEQADISITKMASVSTVLPGDTFNYMIFVKNNGPDDSGLIFADDFLPSEVTFVMVDNPDCSTSGSPPSVDVLCDIDNLASGEEIKITITVQVNAGVAAGTVITNEAQAVPGSGNDVVDPDEENNDVTVNEPTVTETPPQADTSITKSSSVTEVEPGGSFSYDLIVSNAGPNDVTNVGVSDSVGNHMTINGISGEIGTTCNISADSKKVLIVQ